VKYLPLFHHFKAIDQFPKHIIFFVKIVANATLRDDSQQCGIHILTIYKHTELSIFGMFNFLNIDTNDRNFC
jgi:hypothetical protein